MGIPNLSIDIIILGVVALVVVYGVLLGHNKLKTFALSVYVGLVLAETLGQSAADAVGGRYGLGANAVKLVLFIAPLVLLEIGRKDHSRRRARTGMIMTLVLCVLTAMLLVSAGMSLLDPDSLGRTLGNSSLATQIYHLRVWWIGLVPLAIIGENFIKPRDQH